MSRGHGKVQRAILDALEQTPLVRLAGDRATVSAQLRAAKALHRQVRRQARPNPGWPGHPGVS